jgi:2-polyprenyl-6-methoxyphenol hydroxylase-like FAD-dependent oxidoreductase
MGGLLAARSLADHFDEVLVVERDPVPPYTAGRRGVPQGRHAHALLARGRDLLEQHFPGFTDEVVGAGGFLGDLMEDGRYVFNGGTIVRYRSGLGLLCASRPLLESITRERVRRLPNVSIQDATVATGLTQADGRVTGLRSRGAGAGQDELLPADLVVSATGRAASAVQWLAELGHAEPPTEQIEVGITYATRRFVRRPGQLGGSALLVVSPELPLRRGGFVIAQEGDTWMVTLVGYQGERPPLDLDGFTEYAASLPVPDVADLVTRADPVGEPATAHFPASRRRAFERMPHPPEGFLVFGDGISSFNPVYGQGMTVAAEESVALGAALSAGPGDGLPRRFYATASKAVAVPWALAAGSDLRFPEVAGKRTAQTRLLNAYVARLMVAARTDQVVADAFVRVTNLLAAPQSLLRPRIVGRVLRWRHSAAGSAPD